jgi:hypothetical protein
VAQIAEREILDVIRAIETGEVTVTRSDPWDAWGRTDCPEFVTLTRSTRGSAGALTTKRRRGVWPGLAKHEV